MCYLEDHLPFRDMKKRRLNICSPEVVSLIKHVDYNNYALRERESNRERESMRAGEM